MTSMGIPFLPLAALHGHPQTSVRRMPKPMLSMATPAIRGIAQLAHSRHAFTTNGQQKWRCIPTKYGALVLAMRRKISNRCIPMTMCPLISAHNDWGKQDGPPDQKEPLTFSRKYLWQIQRQSWACFFWWSDKAIKRLR